MPSGLKVSATMGMWGWLQQMAAQLMLVQVLCKSASMRPGELCQMANGQPLPQEWCAAN